MRIFVILTVLTCVSIAQPIPATEARASSAPILIELFTSDGCSSCPPVDDWLQQLVKSQPIPGGEVILLSEHVDYFNHDGWQDPYSSGLFTERQSAYARTMGLPSPYTPQVIVNGKGELRLNDPQQMNQILLKAARPPVVPVTISAMSIEGDSPAILRAHIEADGTSEKHNADVYAAVALGYAESQVLRGENGGRHLTHVDVVEELIKIGKLEKGKSFSQDFQAKLKPGTDSKNLRLIVFVQETGLGEVAGAALQQNGTSAR
jgi:hypothetical protein